MRVSAVTAANVRKRPGGARDEHGASLSLAEATALAAAVLQAAGTGRSRGQGHGRGAGRGRGRRDRQPRPLASARPMPTRCGRARCDGRAVPVLDVDRAGRPARRRRRRLRLPGHRARASMPPRSGWARPASSPWPCATRTMPVSWATTSSGWRSAGWSASPSRTRRPASRPGAGTAPSSAPTRSPSPSRAGAGAPLVIDASLEQGGARQDHAGGAEAASRSPRAGRSTPKGGRPPIPRPASRARWCRSAMPRVPRSCSWSRCWRRR